jgi:hypothetical protein
MYNASKNIVTVYSSIPKNEVVRQQQSQQINTFHSPFAVVFVRFFISNSNLLLKAKKRQKDVSH